MFGKTRFLSSACFTMKLAKDFSLAFENPRETEIVSALAVLFGFALDR
jgi:hypothetical protein